MLPLTIQKRLANPGKIENEFLNFLRQANAPIDQSKTIAYQCLYDSKLVTGENQVDFFTGNFVQNRTNIDGAYVRPSSEHFLIYGIRASYVTLFPAEEVTNWNLGFARGFTSADAFASQPQQPFTQSQISVQVNSVRLNKYIPLTEFDNNETAGSRGTIYLDQPILWQGQTEMKITLETNSPDIVFPGTTGEAESAVKFDLFGLALI